MQLETMNIRYCMKPKWQYPASKSNSKFTFFKSFYGVCHCSLVDLDTDILDQYSALLVVVQIQTCFVCIIEKYDLEKYKYDLEK